VKEWAIEARQAAKDLHRKYNLKTTLNWHLVWLHACFLVSKYGAQNIHEILIWLRRMPLIISQIVHWEAFVILHGPVRNYWAWVMERLNRKMKQITYTTNLKSVEVWFLLLLLSTLPPASLILPS
jgi:hypothetical protein